MNQDRVQHIAFNLSSTLSVECNKTNCLSINSQDSQGNWIQSSTIQVENLDEHFVKSEWAHPQFGLLFASSSLDRSIQFFSYSKASTTGSLWRQISSISIEHPIESFDFIGNTLTMKVVLVTLAGQAYVFESDKYKHFNWICLWSSQVSLVGCSSVSSLKTEGFGECFVIGCYSNPNDFNKEPLVKLYGFDPKKNDYYLAASIKTSSESVIDVKWGYQLGKSFHYIAYSDTGCSIHFTSVFFERNPKVNATINTTSSEKKINSIKHKSVIRSLCWNSTATMLSAIDNSGTPLLFTRKSDGEEFILQDRLL